MGGSKQGASRGFTQDSLNRSARAFSTGFPLLQKGMGMAQQAINLGGEPVYMGQAIEGATANAQDAAFLTARQQEQGFASGARPLAAGGNLSAALSPESYGAKMAQIVANSGVSRQNARIGNLLDAAGVGIGQASGAGQLQTQALGNQLGAISMRPTVDPTYANVLAAVNAAGAVYGGVQKAGWLSNAGAPAGQAMGQAMGQSASNSWMLGGAGSGWASNPGVNINWGSMPFNTVGRR